MKGVGNAALQNDILKELAHLTVEQQRQILNFSRFLTASKPVGVQGKRLLDFEGAIDKSDLDLVEKAVEEGCERIDAHEW